MALGGGYWSHAADRFHKKRREGGALRSVAVSTSSDQAQGARRSQRAQKLARHFLRKARSLLAVVLAGCGTPSSGSTGAAHLLRRERGIAGIGEMREHYPTTNLGDDSNVKANCQFDKKRRA
jgi:hypothetical protein